MRVELACQALREQKRLELTYDGWSRTVEVHAVGFTKQNRAVMRVWRLWGVALARSLLAGNCFSLTKFFSACICVRRSARAGGPVTSGTHRDFDVIVCQL